MTLGLITSLIRLENEYIGTAKNLAESLIINYSNPKIKKRILVVDDEPDAGFTIKAMLQQYGFDVDFYSEPIVALSNFKPDFYDLVILDIRMPKINGFELYSQLKSKDSTIKTLFLTALSSVESYNTEQSEVYPKMGERHFIKKPVENQDLLEQVYTLIH